MDLGVNVKNTADKIKKHVSEMNGSAVDVQRATKSLKGAFETPTKAPPVVPTRRSTRRSTGSRKPSEIAKEIEAIAREAEENLQRARRNKAAVGNDGSEEDNVATAMTTPSTHLKRHKRG
jgi:hypothetical protein